MVMPWKLRIGDSSCQEPQLQPRTSTSGSEKRMEHGDSKGGGNEVMEDILKFTKEQREKSDRTLIEVQKQAEEDRKKIEELSQAVQALLAQSEVKQPQSESISFAPRIENPPARSGGSVADLMFIEMRLPTLTGKEKQSEVVSFFYKFRAGTVNHTTQEKRDLLEAKVAGKAARLWEHTSLASESSDFDQNLAEFESELKRRAADHRDWASIYLKPFIRGNNMSIREYADQISDITIRAFAGAPKHILEKHMISKFMAGLNHREASIALAAELHKNLPFEEMVQIATNVCNYDKGNWYQAQQNQSFEAENYLNSHAPAHLSAFWNGPSQNNRSIPQPTVDNYCNGGEHLEKDCHERKDYLKQLREKALAARVNYKANRGSSIVPKIISAGPVEQEPQENSEVKITANCTINEIESLREKSGLKSGQEPFTCSNLEELSGSTEELEFGDLETLFAEPEISCLPSKVHPQTDYTLELSKSAFMSWKHEKKRITPSFEEILDNSVYEKWFSTNDLEIKGPKINVDIPKEDAFESFEKIKELSAKIVPRVKYSGQNIQIPDNCLGDNMFLKSFLPGKGCKFKFLEENHSFNGDFDKNNSIEWSYSSRIEGKGTKFKCSDIYVIRAASLTISTTFSSGQSSLHVILPIPNQIGQAPGETNQLPQRRIDFTDIGDDANLVRGRMVQDRTGPRAGSRRET
uniref:Reverse transcriptase n=1 Tax=Bursaphelenchus xylophilus TaxID=6326 RepID=A0A1I7RIF0_BURXY